MRFVNFIIIYFIFYYYDYKNFSSPGFFSHFFVKSFIYLLFKQFLHFIIDLVCDRPIPSDSIFLAKEIKPLVDAYKLFFKQAVNLALTKDQVYNTNDEMIVGSCSSSIIDYRRPEKGERE